MKHFILLLLIIFSTSGHAKFSLKEKLCGIKFFRTLSGVFSKRSKLAQQHNIFLDTFKPEFGLKMVENIPPGKARKHFFKNLFELADSDELLNHNISELINLSLEKKLIKRSDILEYTKSIYGKTLFYFTEDSPKIFSQVDISPGKLIIMDEILKAKPLGDHYYNGFRKVLIDANFDMDELDIILGKLKGFNADAKQLETFEYYTLYLNTLNKKKRAESIKGISEIFNGDGILTSSVNKKFFKEMDKYKAYEQKEYDKILKRLVKDNNGHETPKLRKRALEEAKGKRMIKQKLAYGCRGKNPSRMSYDSRQMIKKRKAFFTKFNVYSTIPLATTAYAIGHWDEEKDGNWWGLLGYEVSVGMIYSWFGAKFSSNEASSGLQKFWQSYKFNSIADGVSNPAYAFLFGVSGEEAQAKFDELRKDPEFDKKMKELKKTLEDEKVFDKFANRIKDIFNVEQKPGLNPEQLLKLTPEDLDDPEIKDGVMDLIVDQIYEDKSGELIATGNNGVDRYTFMRLYSLAAIPKGVIMGVMIYRAMCQSVNPRRGLAVAVSLILANKLIINPLEYKFRSWAIGQ